MAQQRRRARQSLNAMKRIMHSDDGDVVYQVYLSSSHAQFSRILPASSPGDRLPVRHSGHADCCRRFRPGNHPDHPLAKERPHLALPPGTSPALPASTSFPFIFPACSHAWHKFTWVYNVHLSARELGRRAVAESQIPGGKAPIPVRHMGGMPAV